MRPVGINNRLSLATMPASHSRADLLGERCFFSALAILLAILLAVGFAALTLVEPRELQSLA